MVTQRSKKPYLIILILFTILVLPSIASAEKPERIPAYHDGDIVEFVAVSENVIDVVHKGVAKSAAADLYAFGFPPDQPQFDVIDSIPGDSEYNPWWHVTLVVVLDGRDVTTNPFTSEQDILDAASAGHVALVDTGVYFLCQVLP